eukprot:7072600-Prymnesium_polylepis.2
MRPRVRWKGPGTQPQRAGPSDAVFPHRDGVRIGRVRSGSAVGLSPGISENGNSLTWPWRLSQSSESWPWREADAFEFAFPASGRKK